MFEEDKIYYNETILDLVREHKFFQYLFALLILWIISIGAVIYLSFYLDPIRKLRYSKRVFSCFRIDPIWKPNESLWMQHIIELLSINEKAKFEELDKKVKDDLGETFLEFSASSGKYHLTKVN